MDNRAIGVFDSGLGGLTAVQALRRLLPDEDVVYFGDTGRVPYGTRSAETILRYALQDLRFLMAHSLKCVVVACGTVSSVALPQLQQAVQAPVLGVIDSTVRAAAAATRNGRVGVIGTNATIRSETFQRGLLAINPELLVPARACPLLVPLVEDGRFAPGATVTELLVQEYVAPLLAQDIDTLILGCTHYPLLTDIFRAACGPPVALIDPGHETVRDLRALLQETGGLREAGTPGTERYYVSDSAQNFLQHAGMFLGGPVQGEATRVDIENY